MYPVIAVYKAKCYYPYLMNYINHLIVSFNNAFSVRKLITSVTLSNILLDETDHDFFNQRICQIQEEDNLKIYNKINFYLEKEKLSPIYKNDFSYLYYQFIESDPGLTEVSNNKIHIDYYNSLVMNSLLYVPGPDGNFIIYDENYRTSVEISILNYFAFLIESSKDKIKDDITSQETDYYTPETDSCFKKSLLKPFKKEDILFQPECETDYGNKRVSRKEIKTREEYLKKIITTANKKLYELVEGNIIYGNFAEKPKKVVFCIPNNRDSILNNVKTK